MNEVHGRPAGDEALRRVARTFRSSKCGFDVAARIGGEEFALLVPGSDAHGAYMLAKRIRTEIEQAEARAAVRLAGRRRAAASRLSAV